MSKQTEAHVVCKICKAKFILINAQSNTIIYICVKCTFPEDKKA